MARREPAGIAVLCVLEQTRPTGIEASLSWLSGGWLPAGSANVGSGSGGPWLGPTEMAPSLWEPPSSDDVIIPATQDSMQGGSPRLDGRIAAVPASPPRRPRRCSPVDEESPQPVQRPQQSAAPPSPWPFQTASGRQAGCPPAPVAPLRSESTEVQPIPEPAAAHAPAAAGQPVLVARQPPLHDADTPAASKSPAAVEPSAAQMLQHPPAAVAGDSVLPCAAELADGEAWQDVPGWAARPGSRPPPRSVTPAATGSAVPVSAPEPALPGAPPPLQMGLAPADTAGEQAAPPHLPPPHHRHQPQQEEADTAPAPPPSEPPPAADTTLDVALSADGRWRLCLCFLPGPRPRRIREPSATHATLFLGGNVAPTRPSLPLRQPLHHFASRLPQLLTSCAPGKQTSQVTSSN